MAHSTVRSKQRVVLVEAEDEARVHHHAEVVEPADGGRVVAAQVLPFALRPEPLLPQRLEADEEAPQAAGDGPLEEPRPQHRIDRSRGLPEAPHPPHPVEEGGGEGGVAEEVVVEEVEVPPGKPLDLGERRVHLLHVEGPTAGEEALLVAEGACVRAAPRDDDRVGHEVELAADEVAADGR
jgi:hypothetical protein